MPTSLDLAAVEGKRQFNLMPYPHSISVRGAPFRPTPSSFLHISSEASASARRKAHVFCQQMLEIGYRTTLTTATGLNPTSAVFTPSATLQKWAQADRPLRGEVAKPSGYRLTITSEGALLQGTDEQGLQYAAVTLRQLMQDLHNIPGMEIEDYPLLPWRVIHWDFKGWAPTAAHLKHTITTLAHLKINAIILEYEAFFDFPSQPGLAAEGALTPDQVTEVELYAQDLGVTLIPLVPCIGNAGYVLKLPAYAELREHPDYIQQYCPVKPATLDIVTAMMEDLLAVHPGKYFHIGGDEVRLLGCNPNSEQRSKQLGGRAALYLEYIGKICRYLLSRERQPLVWDDMFRRMSDEQVKWLPPEVTLTFWEYDGQGGRATPAILSSLDRYRRLGRQVWGAATRLPSARYDAFDNIDAWAEAAELGYLNGLITTTWTRDYALGPMFSPADTAWPGACYSAERMWTGRRGMAREQFPETYILRMFGVKDANVQSRLWAGFDLMMRGHARRARDFFVSDLKQIPRNAGLVAFLESWTALGALREYVQQFEETISASFANLQAGRGDPFNMGRLRWRVADLKGKAPTLAKRFSENATRLALPSSVQEYLDSMLAFNLERLDSMESLLQSYPLPTQEWQQPVHV